MDEEIFTAIVGCNEPETLTTIEPFHLPCLLVANISNNSSSNSIFRHRRKQTPNTKNST
jgi:hypothetical protein